MVTSRKWFLILCFLCIYLDFHRVTGRKTSKKSTAIDKLIQEYKSYKKFKINHGFSKSVKRTTIIDENDSSAASRILPNTKIESVSGYVKSRVQPKQTRSRSKQKAAHEIYEDRHKSVVDSITFVAPQPKKNLKLIMSNPHPDENLLLKLLPLNAKNFPDRVITEDSLKEYHANQTDSSPANSKIDKAKTVTKIKTKSKILEDTHKTGQNKKVKLHNLDFLNISDSKKLHQKNAKFNADPIDSGKDDKIHKGNKGRELHKEGKSEYFEEDKNNYFYEKDTEEFRERDKNRELYERGKDTKLHARAKNSEIYDKDKDSEILEKTREYHKVNNDLTTKSQTKTVLKYPQTRQEKNADNRTSIKNQPKVYESNFSEKTKKTEKNTRLDQDKFDIQSKKQENDTFERINKKLHNSKPKVASGSQFNTDKLKEYISPENLKTEDQILEDKKFNAEYLNRSSFPHSSKNHPSFHTNYSSTEKNIFSVSLGNISQLNLANKQHKDNSLNINSKKESIKKSTRKKWRATRKPLFQNIHIKSFQKPLNNFKRNHQNKQPVILVAKIADDLDRNTFVEDIFKALGISDILKVDVSRDQGEELHYSDDELSGETQSVTMNNFESFPEKLNIKHTSRENSSTKNKSFPKTYVRQANFFSPHALKSTRLHDPVGHIVND